MLKQTIQQIQEKLAKYSNSQFLLVNFQIDLEYQRKRLQDETKLLEYLKNWDIDNWTKVEEYGAYYRFCNDSLWAMPMSLDENLINFDNMGGVYDKFAEDEKKFLAIVSEKLGQEITEKHLTSFWIELL